VLLNEGAILQVNMAEERSIAEVVSRIFPDSFVLNRKPAGSMIYLSDSSDVITPQPSKGVG
jgi:hypothetical protein